MPDIIFWNRLINRQFTWALTLGNATVAAEAARAPERPIKPRPPRAAVFWKKLWRNVFSRDWGTKELPLLPVSLFLAQIPLSAAAVIVIREQIGKHSTHVFSYRSRSVMQVNTKAWRRALAKVGISTFRWHDLRHTWASWHVQAGTPLHVLHELGCWECVEMVRKYAHLSGEHLIDYVDRVSTLKVVASSLEEYATFGLRAAK
ncbi:MAG: tyrosine-type recombinase/integrase [Thiobacillaceae bacterium]